VVGEAGSRIPVEFRDEHPETPWFGVVGLRNRLIRGYDDIDYGIVWQILTDDIPSLVVALQEATDDLDS